MIQHDKEQKTNKKNNFKNISVGCNFQDQDFNTLYLFKMVKKYQPENKKNKHKIICSVCMEKNARASIDCDHKFCMFCISKWTKRNSTCPLCRSDITQIKYGKNTKRVEPRRKNISIFRSEAPDVRVRMTWKPIIFVRLSYFNYFFPWGNIAQPFLF